MNEHEWLAGENFVHTVSRYRHQFVAKFRVTKMEWLADDDLGVVE